MDCITKVHDGGSNGIVSVPNPSSPSLTANIVVFLYVPLRAILVSFPLCLSSTAVWRIVKQLFWTFAVTFHSASPLRCVKGQRALVYLFSKKVTLLYLWTIALHHSFLVVSKSSRDTSMVGWLGTCCYFCLPILESFFNGCLCFFRSSQRLYTKRHIISIFINILSSFFTCPCLNYCRRH